MTHRGALEREWRQFRLLSRDSVRRLLDSVLVARDADPMQFALWGLALLMTPPLITAINKSSRYAFLLRADPDVVERIVLADRLYFIIYGMLATALLAAFTWDALFPDRADQEIVGALPVRPRTLAAARFGAAAALGLGFAAAINAIPAFMYTAASAVHPLVGSFPRVFVAHLAATMLGCTFVFFALMSLRAIVAICAGERIAERLAIVLQIVTVVALVEVFLFLPGVLGSFVREVQQGVVNPAAMLPPIWFAGLFGALGEGKGPISGFAGTAFAATAFSGVLAVALSLVPAAWMGRRALQTRAREHATGLMSVARLVAAVGVRAPAVRALFLFAVASLSRSRRHALVLASCAGLAIAVCGLSLLTAEFRGRLRIDEPRSYLIALPLVFMFFAVFGMRASFAIPTDVDANWPFRLRQPSLRAAVSASRLVILTFGIVPITVTWLLFGLAVWPVHAAVSTSLMTLASGVMLSELALVQWTKVPFATAHEPATATLKSRWPWFVVALHVFGFPLAEVQQHAIGSNTRIAVYVVLTAGIAAAARIYHVRTLRLRQPTLDALDEDRFQTLSLSEAEA